MLDIPLAMWGAMQWADATAKLKKQLDREPTENEVRAELGYPLVVGRALVSYGLNLGGMAGCNVSIPGTPYRIAFSEAEKGVEITLFEVAAKTATPTLPRSGSSQADLCPTA